MGRYHQLYTLAALGMALIGCSYGQSHHAPSPAPTAIPLDQSGVDQLPTRQLTFAASDPVAGLKTSPVVMLPIQCTSDGALFLDMLQPPSFMQQAIYAVTSKSNHGFDVSAIRDLHGTHLMSFFPGDRHVSVLVRATSESPLPGEASVRQSSYGYFVALFNRQGDYVKSVELKMHGIQPSHVAELSSGEYLVTGYDRANDLPQLYLISDDDGRVIRTLDLPDNVGEYVRSADPSSPQGMMNYGRVLGSILMTAHGNEVLVWRRGGSGPIVSVGDHGSIRQVSLDVPKGLALAEVLPSDKLWVARFQETKPHTDDQQDPGKTAQDSSKVLYYQFDPSNGSLTSRLSIRGQSPEYTPFVIACEEEGTFLSYKTDGTGATRILSAR